MTEIDSPAPAILFHLLAIQQEISGASAIKLPPADRIAAEGLETARLLKRLPMSAHAKSALRTVEYSIGALRNGLEADIGPSKGGPYLEDREQAVADNISDLVLVDKVPSLLVLYGADHVSRSLRSDGGPNRDQSFQPLALRLKKAGINAFSVVTFPLEGRSFWRGRADDLLWSPADGHLESGETFDRVLAANPNAKFLYIDAARERAYLPSQDISRYAVDAFPLFRSGTPKRNRCAVPQ